MVIISSVYITIYQGRKLLLGNIIQYRQAHGEYLIRAQEYFDKGDFASAQGEVEACAKTLKRDRCINVQNSLSTRRVLEQNVNKIITESALDLDGKIRLLNDLSVISGKNKFLKNFERKMLLKKDNVYKTYKQALVFVNTGKFKEAISKLNEIHLVWTDYGHNRFLYRELLKLISVSEKERASLRDRSIKQGSKYPYLSALYRMGVDQYAKKTAESSTLALKKFKENRL